MPIDLAELARRKARAAQNPPTWWHGVLSQWDPPGEPNEPAKKNPHPKMRGVGSPAEREQMALERQHDYRARAGAHIDEMVARGDFRMDDEGNLYQDEQNPEAGRRMYKMLRAYHGRDPDVPVLGDNRWDVEREPRGPEDDDQGDD